MSDKVYLGRQLADLDVGEESLPISRVNLNIDSETYYTAGDDSGAVLECDCPWGTQTMADSLLSKLKGFTYKPFSGLDAFLDPAAEMGDGITVGGMYSMLASMGRNFDRLSTATVGAPTTDEIEDEYPYKTKQQRLREREMTRMRSYITKTAGEINLAVEENSQSIAELKLTTEDISASVSDMESGLSQTLRIAADGVTITNAQGSKLTIDGGQIDAENLNLSGRITFGDLESSVQNDINDAYAMAQAADSTVGELDGTVGELNKTVSRWTYSGTTYIDGSRIMAGTVTASTLEGGEIALLDQYGDRAGTITLDAATSASFAVDILSEAAIRLRSSNNETIYIGAGAEYPDFPNITLYYAEDVNTSVGYGFISVSALTFMPHANASCHLGATSNPWEAVYSKTATIQTSDRNKKHDISYELSKYDGFFDSLKPASSKMNDGASGRTHINMIAQDVEDSLIANGLSSMDFAGLIKTPNEFAVEGYDYALRYGEFVPLCIEQIQRLKKRVAELEAKYDGNTENP